MKLAALLSVVPAALAFMDAGALYCTSKMHLLLLPDAYAIDLANAAAIVEAASRQACLLDGRVVVHRIPPVSASELRRMLGTKVDDGFFAPYVRYASAEQVDLPVLARCSAAQTKYTTHSAAADEVAVLVVDYDEGEFAGFMPSPNVVHIVQARPRLHAPAASPTRRDSANAAADAAADLAAEVEADFASAASYIASEGDMPVHILGPAAVGAAAASNATHSNLFTHYQFFTPGILLCLIVSGVLVAILYTALTWMTAVEILYKAFDKQVDFEKKNE
jgi:hypothetical protein